MYGTGMQNKKIWLMAGLAKYNAGKDLQISGRRGGLEAAHKTLPGINNATIYHTASQSPDNHFYFV